MGAERRAEGGRGRQQTALTQQRPEFVDGAVDALAGRLIANVQHASDLGEGVAREIAEQHRLPFGGAEAAHRVVE